MFSPKKKPTSRTPLTTKFPAPPGCWGALGEEPRGALHSCGGRWKASVQESDSRSATYLYIVMTFGIQPL